MPENPQPEKTDLLAQAFDPQQFRSLGHQLVDMLADHLGQTADPDSAQPVFNWQPPDDAYSRWKDTDFQGPQQLFESVLKQAIHLHNPRFMGHQVNPVLPVSALSGLLDGLLNNGMAIYEMGVPGTVMERQVIELVTDRMQLGPAASGFLTSGGTLANLTALVAAREIAFANRPEIKNRPLAILVSEEAHYCMQRAVRVMGWGEDGLVQVPSDDRFRMRTELLPEIYQKVAAAGREVVAVVASACSTSTGSFDNIQEVVSFCRNNGLWCHVDGAHGGAVVFCDKYRHLVDGIGNADSVVLDFHKMLLTPAVVSGLVFRDGKHAYQTFNNQAEYLWREAAEPDEWFNLAKRTLECTKSMMSLKVYASLVAHGPQVFDQYITRVIELGKSFAELIRGRDRFQLAVDPSINIVCFRHFPIGVSVDSSDSTAVQINAHNERVRETIMQEGHFYIVQTVIRGQTWLRTTLTNPFTTTDHLGELLDRIEEVATAGQ